MSDTFVKLKTIADLQNESAKFFLKEQDYVFTSRLFKDGFQHVYGIDSEKSVLSIDAFRKLNKLLNVLSKRQEQTGSISFATGDEYDKTYLEETRSFLRLIGTSDARALTNEEQVVLYAEYAFLIKYANDDDTFTKEVELNRWLRLVSNLVKPTLNLQLDIFFNMIRSVNRLIEEGEALKCDDYMSRLLRRNYRQSAMSVFTETQVVEESIMKLAKAFQQKIDFLGGQLVQLDHWSGIIGIAVCAELVIRQAGAQSFVIEQASAFVIDKLRRAAHKDSDIPGFPLHGVVENRQDLFIVAVSGLLIGNLIEVDTFV